MNPLFNFNTDRLRGLFAGLAQTSPEAGAAPATTDANASMGMLLSNIAGAAPGSLRRGVENSGFRDAVQSGLDTAAFYAGPHLTERATAIPQAAKSVTENMFGNQDAREAAKAFVQGKYGAAAAKLGLGTAGALLDVPSLGAGSGMIRGILKGIVKGAHQLPYEAIFAGPMAATANKAMLTQAEKMAATGADRASIWDKTGWFQGPDKKWRFEIPDNEARFHAPQDASALLRGEMLKHSDYVTHPQAAAAYPAVANTPAQHLTMRGAGPLGDGTLGAYSPTTGYIFNAEHAPSGYAASKMSPREIERAHAEGRSTALHETQHQVQDIEGFARGGNPGEFVYANSPLFNQRRSYETPEDAYRRLAGEVEARNVQTRMNMAPDERRAKPPWETQDVPDERQIVKQALGLAQNKTNFWDRFMSR